MFIGKTFIGKTCLYVLGKTCFKAVSVTFADVMLTNVMLKNRPRSFQKTVIIETSLRNHHKLIVSFFRTHFARLKKLNTETIKNLIRKAFFMSFIKNYER